MYLHTQQCVLSYGTDWPIAVTALELDSKCIMSYVIAIDFYIAAEMRVSASTHLQHT